MVRRGGVREMLPAAAGADAVGLVEMRGQLPCSLTDPNTAYSARSPAFDVTVADDLEQCRSRCFENGQCSAWTWKPGGECSLFELEQDEMPTKEAAAGAMSGGLPCGGDYIRPAGSLYCFALMNPSGYETELLQYIIGQHTSLFACDLAEVFSNKEIALTAEVSTIKVDVDLECDSGGEFGTALNLDIFLEIWDAVFRRARWAVHEWTVKVDPDCVFFPDRLRTVLAHHVEPPNGIYLNNCKFGMHGPIEVFSKNAVGAFQAAGDQCKAHFQQLCQGDCKWGEDIWVDQCLEFLNVKRENEWQLLVEDHCDAPTPFGATTACDGNHVSFHPFKDVDSYAQCMSYSQVPAQTETIYRYRS
jgi:hypothetical protein